MKRWLYYILPVVLLISCIIVDPLYSGDMWICDSVYNQLDGTDPRICIIGVDEETLDAYGNYNVWSREKVAELIEMLSKEEKNAPAVIGLDFLFTGDYDAVTDERLAKACEEAGNVVVASNLVFRGATIIDDNNNMYYDKENIDKEELPYEALAAVTEAGYTNTYISDDGYIRLAKPQTMYGETLRNSFSYEIYETYQESIGAEAVLPETNEAGRLRFFYSGISREYRYLSMKDVLDGKIPLSEFKDCIVLVGAYAPGFQDAYAASVDRGNMMYGVEINANMVQAFMEGKTAINVPKLIHGLFAGAILCLYLVICRKQKLAVNIVGAIVLAAAHLFAGKMLSGEGLLISQIYVLGILFALCIYSVIEKYLVEYFKRKELLQTFKKYVAPQVVEELSRNGQFELHLGGEKRDVAVLFVDIRGFTPMSENLSPEEVVGILNEYLSLTTKSIFAHEGTLDKFIGDATMAVFNAPFDLDDYIYHAVCTAWDIRTGSEALSAQLMERFGRTISFGVGVNCGEAVVGNIGCDVRMDYTAIGDTVNTAARLESNAKPGEILISEVVYEAVKDRIEAEDVGELALKGKKKAVKVYRMTALKG